MKGGGKRSLSSLIQFGPGSPTRLTNRKSDFKFGAAIPFCSFVKIALTKNPKKRPAAERLLFHPFVLAGDLTARLSLELLQKVSLSHQFISCSLF